jgi:hypothetical protein
MQLIALIMPFETIWEIVLQVLIMVVVQAVLVRSLDKLKLTVRVNVHLVKLFRMVLARLLVRVILIIMAVIRAVLVRSLGKLKSMELVNALLVRLLKITNVLLQLLLVMITQRALIRVLENANKLQNAKAMLFNVVL